MTREKVAEWLRFLQEAEHNKADSIVPCTNEIALGIAIEALKQPQIVRCNDCKYHGSEDCPLFTDAVEFVTDDDWFCANGERKPD